jgi:putative sigma-54 modulation protein
MEVQTVAREFSLTPSLRGHLLRCLRVAFAHAHDRAMRVVVRLRDLNGPRGGRDKLCQVSITIPGRPLIVIRKVHADMYAAIDRAAKRAAYTATRITERMRKERHHG